MRYMVLCGQGIGASRRLLCAASYSAIRVAIVKRDRPDPTAFRSLFTSALPHASHYNVFAPIQPLIITLTGLVSAPDALAALAFHHAALQSFLCEICLPISSRRIWSANLRSKRPRLAFADTKLSLM
jgi:nicotinic acid phosphoribosyltransferase